MIKGLDFAAQGQLRKVPIPLKLCDLNDITDKTFFYESEIKLLKNFLGILWCVENPENLVFFGD